MKRTVVFAVVVFSLLVFATHGFCATAKDTLVVAVASDVHLLDPAVSSDNYDWRQIYPSYDRLVKYKVVKGEGSTEVEPMAAESWKVSSDGMVWTIKIRKGIKFEDGTPLDAKAVKFSFDRVLEDRKGTCRQPRGNQDGGRRGRLHGEDYPEESVWSFPADPGHRCILHHQPERDEARKGQ